MTENLSRGEGSRTRLGIGSPLRSDTRETAPTITEQRKVRKRRGITDPFFIPPELIPEGMSWEYKRESNVGQPDTSHQSNLVANCWEAVDSSRVPELAAAGATGPHRHHGQILMERPTYLCEEARQEEIDAAVGRAYELEHKLGVSNPGEAPRFSGKAGRPGERAVSRSYENLARVAVPD